MGAAIVKDGTLISYGFNASPDGTTPCKKSKTYLSQEQKIPPSQSHEICNVLHAKQRTIIMAKNKGINIGSSTLYITNSPCSICSRLKCYHIFVHHFRRVYNILKGRDIMPRKYDNNFKSMIINLIVNEKHSTIKTAEQFEIPLKTVEKWITAYNKDSHCFDAGYKTQAQIIDDLKRKVASLQKDNEILKKQLLY